MRRVDVHGEGVSVRLFPTETTALTAPTRFRSTLFGIWIRISVRPAAVFITLSLAFGGLIISGTPPLRGPDEISHFVRIYSYARGEILPTKEINGRKGILVEPRLYSELQFFRTAGEVFAREDGLHYPQLVAGYRTRLVLQSLMSPTKHLFSLHSRAPKATTRSHTFPTSLRQQ